MVFVKNFQILVVGSDLNSVIANLGTFPYTAIRVTGLQGGHAYDMREDYVDAGWVFGSTVTDEMYIGNVIPGDYLEINPEFYSYLLRLAPLSVIRKAEEYAGSYLKLAGNDSGYYAVSRDPITSQGFVTIFDLYDNHDNLISFVSGVVAGFPLSDSAGISNLAFMDDLTDGVIPLGTSLYYIRANSAGGTFMYGSIQGSQLGDGFIRWYNALTRGGGGDDPYDDTGDDSSEGGGGGGGGDNTDNYDPDGDDNPEPSLPTISATDTGFITLYNPTVSQLQNLASYLWTGLFDINSFRKIMANPMDAILGLSIVPVDVPNSGTRAVTVGNISTGINMNIASSQYVKLDCGSIPIKEYWKGYMDYSPYTRLGVFLPYIGYRELDVDLYQLTSLGISYHIDVLSGGCVAFVKADSRVIAQFTGQCSTSIPISANDFTRTIATLGQLVASGVALGVTGGMSAPMSAAGAAGMGAAARGLGDTATNVITSKPTYATSGNMGSSNGLLGTQKPYMILTRPKQCHPRNQSKYTGYPSYITYMIGTLTGFTIMLNAHLEGVSCTDEERNEIMSLLTSGVIL